MCGWQLASPARPAEKLDDGDYVLTARALLGQSVRPRSAPTCCNVAGSGARAGVPCGEPLDDHHPHRCNRGGQLNARSAALEDVWEAIHRECGCTTARQVHVPAWDRWKWVCAACPARRPARQAGPCECGAQLGRQREEAILDLEASSAEYPRVFFDVTVRHSVPANPERLRAAARHDGAVNAEAEADKLARYPDGATPWRALPLAHETFGRLGRRAYSHLRQLARAEVAKLQGDDVWGVHNLVARWGARLSAALHRANARAVRRSCGIDSRSARARWLEEG